MRVANLNIAREGEKAGHAQSCKETAPSTKSSLYFTLINSCNGTQ